MKSKVLATIIILASTVCIAQEIKRPKDLWVFRSVLDKRPGMITVALHENLYVAYDGKNGGLFKVWKEGVVLDGAVYTAKHGPQPTSLGKAYSMGIVDKPIWNLYKNNVALDTKVQFMGYIWKDNKVTFHYILTAENSPAISIYETPEYTFKAKENKTGLDRRFLVKNIPEGYQVALNIFSENLVKKTDFFTDGKFAIEAKTERYLNTGTVYDLKGSLFLKSDKETKLITYYDPNSVK